MKTHKTKCRELTLLVCWSWELALLPTSSHHPNMAQGWSSSEAFVSYRKEKAEEHRQARAEFCRDQAHHMAHRAASKLSSKSSLPNYPGTFCAVGQDLNRIFWAHPGASRALITRCPVHSMVTESRSWGQLQCLTAFCGSVTHPSCGWNRTVGHWLTAPARATEQDAFSTD